MSASRPLLTQRHGAPLHDGSALASGVHIKPTTSIFGQAHQCVAHLLHMHTYVHLGQSPSNYS
jgi:hypothetical protein